MKLPADWVLSGWGLWTPSGYGWGPWLEALRGARPPSDIAAARVPPSFDIDSLIDPNRSRRMDPASLVAVLCSHWAAEDARLPVRRNDGQERRWGVCFGTCLGAQQTTLRYGQKLARTGAYFTNPIDFPDSIDGAPAAHVAMELGFRGPNTTHVDGAVSADLALLTAALDAVEGRVDGVLWGGGDDTSPLAETFAARWGLACPTPGTAVAVFEPLPSALRRGVTPWARVVSVGLGQAGCRPHRWARTVSYQMDAMRSALSDAATPPEAVSCVLGCGAPGEGEAVQSVFGPRGTERWACAPPVHPMRATGALRAATACAILRGLLRPEFDGLGGACWTSPGEAMQGPILLHAAAPGGQAVSVLLVSATD